MDLLMVMMVKVDQAHQNMRNKLANDDFRDEGTCQRLSHISESCLDSDDCLDAATVHVFHNQVDHALVVEDAVILNKKWH